MLAPIEIAILEEGRQALGTAEVADEAEAVGGGWMAYAGPGSSANQAAGMGLAGPVGEEELERLIEFYSSRGVEPRLELAPFASAALVAGLARRGFGLVEFTSVLARELSPAEDLAALALRKAPGLELERVDPADSAALEAFVALTTRGFFESAATVPAGHLRLSLRIASHPRCEAWLARIDGEPAGGGLLELAGAHAALIGASVLPPFRRRGIQAALFVRRLARAREQGAQLVCVQSRPGIATESNALRAGFRLAYTKATLTRPGPHLEPSP